MTNIEKYAPWAGELDWDPVRHTPVLTALEIALGALAAIEEVTNSLPIGSTAYNVHMHVVKSLAEISKLGGQSA